MKAAIERVVVFGLTLGAHGELCHRGLRSVVGDATGNCESRSAVCAIQEGVTIAAITRIEQLAKAVGAGGGVCRNSGADTAEHFAGDDAKTGFSRGRHVGGENRIDARQRRRFRGESLQEDPNVSQRPFEFNGDAVGVVADKAGKVLLICQAIDERTKADALDDPADPDAYPLTRSIGIRRG